MWPLRLAVVLCFVDAAGGVPEGLCPSAASCVQAEPTEPAEVDVSTLLHTRAKAARLREADGAGEASRRRMRLLQSRSAGRELAAMTLEQAQAAVWENFKDLSGDDGVVTLEDLRRSSEDAGEDAGLEGDCQGQADISDGQLGAMIAALDTDKSGDVSESEFEAYAGSPKFARDMDEHLFSALSIEACERLAEMADTDQEEDAAGEASLQQALDDIAREQRGLLRFREGVKAKRGAGIQNHTAMEQVDREVNGRVAEAMRRSLQSGDSAGGGSLAQGNATAAEGQNPILQWAVEHGIQDAWEATGFGDEFSPLRAVSPTKCNGICQAWEDKCTDWVDQSYEQCTKKSQRTSRACSVWGEETTRYCRRKLWSWFGWLCGWYSTVTRTVCAGWKTVTDVTCDVWQTVSDGFCRASSYICKAFECMVDWKYILDTADPPAHVGGASIREETITPLQKAAIHLTGGRIFSSEITDDCRHSSMKTLELAAEKIFQDLRARLATEERTEDIYAWLQSAAEQDLVLPECLREAAAEAWTIAATGAASVLQTQGTASGARPINSPEFPALPESWALTISFQAGASYVFDAHKIHSPVEDRKLAMSGIEVGLAVGMTGGEWKNGTFVDMWSPGNFETDVGFGVAFSLGIWNDFAYIAGRAVDWGIALDLGLLAPGLAVLTGVPTLGVGLVGSFGGMSVNFLHTVPNSSQCDQQNEWRKNHKWKNPESESCSAIRWGHDPESHFAAVVLSFTLGVSALPISVESGASCATGTWEGGRNKDVDCFRGYLPS